MVSTVDALRKAGKNNRPEPLKVSSSYEVAEVRAWPLDLAHLPTKKEKREYLDRAEFTLFLKVIAESKLRAVLNEKQPKQLPTVELPKPFARRIIPDRIFPERKHPDVRIARRASTIASLARVISERKVKADLRRVLLTQARRLERLARERLLEFRGQEEEGEKACQD